ncbi:class I SAM-dependent methyltransferase [Thioalkalivibrio sp. ALE12]|uniref:class I SAM-dependent methyltransferase n=1 Tax=Thioalkalivibrio sp. ALE12 TaxID=1158170 RepID=UPI000375BDF4|nr:class I SAM-dependent methyltransferase [Thioalkalivibrio sp. ALE12]
MTDALARLRASLRKNGWWRTLTLIPRNILFHLTDFDRKYGTNTGMQAEDDAGLPQEHEGYEGAPPRLFHRIVRSLQIAPSRYAFIDLGSGKGKALLLASHHPFRRVIGVEYNARLNDIATENARLYQHPERKVANIETVCGDAGAYDLPAGDLLIYLFNPFKAAIMERVLANLENAIRTEPREVLVVYQNPTQRKLLDAAPFLEPVTYREYRTKRFRKMPIGRVAVYRSRT